MLNTLSQNPNLPPQRKNEIDEKRKKLQESIEATLYLHRENNTPINQVMSEINNDGDAIASDMIWNLSRPTGARESVKMQSQFMDCSDGILCSGGNNVFKYSIRGDVPVPGASTTFEIN